MSGVGGSVKAPVRRYRFGAQETDIRADDDLMGTAQYILANPVRAGLVNQPADYPFLGSDRWSLDELIRSAV